jgi:hypothetical protein
MALGYSMAFNPGFKWFRYKKLLLWGLLPVIDVEDFNCSKRYVVMQLGQLEAETDAMQQETFPHSNIVVDFADKYYDSVEFTRNSRQQIFKFQWFQIFYMEIIPVLKFLDLILNIKAVSKTRRDNATRRPPRPPAAPGAHARDGG